MVGTRFSGAGGCDWSGICFMQDRVTESRKGNRKEIRKERLDVTKHETNKQ